CTNRKAFDCLHQKQHARCQTKDKSSIPKDGFIAAAYFCLAQTSGETDFKQSCQNQNNPVHYYSFFRPILGFNQQRPKKAGILHSENQKSVHLQPSKMRCQFSDNWLKCLTL